MRFNSYRIAGLLLVLFLTSALPLASTTAAPNQRTQNQATAVSGFGVNSHVASRYPRFETLEAAANVVESLHPAIVREDVSMDRTHPAPDKWDWTWHDRVFDAHQRNGTRIIAVLGPGVGWASPEPGIAPDAHSFWPPSPDVYAAWAGAVARHYKGRGMIYEIWNEPDHPYHWRPSPDAAAYSRLLIAAAAAIRAADPGALIVSGGAGPFEASFLERMGEQGGWAVVDALSIHPYVDPSAPEAGLIAANGITALEPLMQRFGKKPIFVTEFGWGSGACERDPKGTTDEEAQANYLVRGALLLRAAGVGPILWYNLKDEREPCYGLLRAGSGKEDLSQLKPAAHALRVLSDEIGSRPGSHAPSLQASQLVLGFEDGQGWDAPFPAGSGTVTTSSEQVHGGRASARVDYRMPSAGNDYLAYVRSVPTPLPAGTTRVGLWVYGDGSGHRMALHLVDSQNETLHYPLGVIAHRGWQWLSTTLSAPAEGGSGNLVIDGTANIRAVVVDDHPDSRQGGGTIFWDDLLAFTGPDVYAVRFGSPDALTDVLWSLTPATIQVPTGSREARLVDRWGKAQTLTASNGKLQIAVGPAPVYLHHQAPPDAPPQQPPPTSAPLPPYNGTTAPAFEPVWARPDRPIAEGRVQRGWVWGPEPRSAPATEPYAEAPGGERLVQYYDKTRMELTRPGGPVTNGLLVVELLTGRRQVGDARFEPGEPAAEAVAGDPAGQNPQAPTYRALGMVAFPRNTARAAVQTGQPVLQTLNGQGQVGSDESLARYEVRYGPYDTQLGHNVAAPFAAFFSQQGLVYENGYRQGQIFDAGQVVGLPLSEPYWTRARVGGIEKDVLIQPFQRRVLTYTPENAPDQRVEMGNVGLHYLSWRYGR